MRAVWNQGVGDDETPSSVTDELEALIEPSRMEEIFASFLEVTGLPVAIIDLRGKVLASSKWQRICLEHHRANAGTLARCLDSDVALSREMQEGKEIAIYRCPNGLTDCAAPIIVDGQHLANLFIGQFLLEQPDLAFFKRQQAAYGFDEETYFQALSEVPIVAEAKLPAILKLITGLARQVADLSLARTKALQCQVEVEHRVVERTRQLIDSETRLHAAERIARLGNWELDLNQNRLTWSPEIYRIFEADPEPFGASYETFLETVHPDDREKVTQAFIASLENHTPYAITHRLLMRDGRIKYVHERGETNYDDDGKALRTLGTVQDITERKQTELALRESEALYRGLFNAGGDAVFVHGILPSGEPDKFQQVNLVACQRLGYSESELLAMSPRDIDAGDMYLSRQDAVKQLLEGGHVLFEMTHIAKDGRRIPVETSARRIELHGRSMVLSVARDITERKRVEDALQRQLSSLKALNEISASHFTSLTDALRKALSTGASLLGLEFGIVSHVVDESYEVVVQVSPEQILQDGQVFPLGITYCALTLEQGDVLAIPHMGASPYPVHPCYESFKLEAYIGTPVLVAGKPFGTVNFSSATPYPRTFDDGDKEFMLLLGRWVGATIERHQSQQRLAASEAHLKAIIDNEPECVKVVTPDGKLTQMNRAGLDMLEVDEVEEVNATGLINFVVPEHRQNFKKLNQRIYGGDSGTLEFMVHGKCGTLRWLETHATPLRDAEGKVTSLLSVTRDITDRKHTEAQLRLAASVFQHSHEGIILTDADNRIVDVNEAFTRITGYDRAEVLGRNPSLLKSGHQNPEMYAGMWTALQQDGYWQGEIWNRRKDGVIFPELLTISAVQGANGEVQHYVAVFADISHIKDHQQELEHMAHYDALTNLPNRVLFADRMHQAMAQVVRHGQRLAVAYLDLDGFKQVNDAYGHEIGDQLLIIVASRMKRALRDCDSIARLGGDEFVVVASDLDDVQASVPMLERLLDAAAQPVRLGDLVLQVSASIGVTLFPQPEIVDADQLLRQADQAMYQAKLSGKHRYHIFDPEQDRSVRGYHENLEHIRRALAEAEFVLYYQPKVNMRTGRIVGVEALIRWEHPDQGVLAPATFLPVIENHPLAVELGEWVIDTALSQMDTWRNAGLDILMSINIGALQLQQADFTKRLRTLLDSHPHCNPGNLVLEVLETSALEDMAHVSQVMHACNEMGIRFALDDFGTGYSSLTYLKRLPAAQLKIDCSFVRNMLDNPEDLAILHGVLGLAKSFRRQVIAEGVETVDHGVMLLQLGCELAQGYGIAKPMPAADFPAWMSNWRPDPAWCKQGKVNLDVLPMLFARVEHYAWMRTIDQHLSGQRKTPPSLDYRQCRFGQWLESEGQSQYGECADFQYIGRLHRLLHAKAMDLLEAHSEKADITAASHLCELNELSSVMIQRLNKLIQRGTCQALRQSA